MSIEDIHDSKYEWQEHDLFKGDELVPEINVKFKFEETQQIKDQMCVIGLDSNGDITEELMTERKAEQCENCHCTQLLSKCLLGPDSRGDLIKIDMSYKNAEFCDRSYCTCDVHEGYETAWSEREANAIGKIIDFNN